MLRCTFCQGRISRGGCHRCSPHVLADRYARKVGDALGLPASHRIIAALRAAWIDGFGHHQWLGGETRPVEWKTFASPMQHPRSRRRVTG